MLARIISVPLVQMNDRGWWFQYLEEASHEVQPRAADRPRSAAWTRGLSGVDVSRPCTDFGVLVRGVVVANHYPLPVVAWQHCYIYPEARLPRHEYLLS